MQNNLDNILIGTRFYCEKNGKRYRVVRESEEDIFVYAKGKQRYGYRMSKEDFLANYNMILPKDKTEEWHKRIRRAIRAIQSSELWTEHLQFLQNLLQMSWEDHEAIYNLYWQSAYTPEYADVWNSWFAKYPFLKGITVNGDIYVDTNYLWEMSQVKLKSIYFGKHRNKQIKDKIKVSIADKKHVSNIHERVGYDVSFSYDADKGHAWYSEEYRDCGNGHYYLALNENVAWFCEDD